jgi:hypothetical protein
LAREILGEFRRRKAEQEAYGEVMLTEKVVALIRELRHFPTEAALRIKRRSDATFPSSKRET